MTTTTMIDRIQSCLTHALRKRGFEDSISPSVNVLEAPTGSGKTQSTVRALCAMPNTTRAFIIVPTKMAREQIRKQVDDHSRIHTVTPLQFITHHHHRHAKLHAQQGGGGLKLWQTVLVIDEYHTLSSDYELLFHLLRKRWYRNQFCTILLLSAHRLEDRLTLTFGHNNFSRLSTDSSLSTPFPIRIIYAPNLSIHSSRDIVATIRSTNATKVMVFLASKIECENMASSSIATEFIGQQWSLYAIHGGVPDYELEKTYTTLMEADKYDRYIIFCTNMCQTSITIPDIDLVLDGGVHYREQQGTVALGRIDQASFEQRAGRTGRTKAGTVVRFISENEFSNLPFVQNDLSVYDWYPMIMILLQLHLRPMDILSDVPNLDSMMHTMVQYGCVDVGTGKPTEKGRQIMQLPMRVKLAAQLFDIWHCIPQSRPPPPEAIIRTMVSILQDMMSSSNHFFWIPHRTTSAQKRMSTLMHIQTHCQAFHFLFLEDDMLHSTLNVFLTALQFTERSQRKRFCKAFSLNNKAIAMACKQVHMVQKLWSPGLSWLERLRPVMDFYQVQSPRGASTDYHNNKSEEDCPLFTIACLSPRMMERVREEIASVVTHRWFGGYRFFLTTYDDLPACMTSPLPATVLDGCTIMPHPTAYIFRRHKPCNQPAYHDLGVPSVIPLSFRVPLFTDLWFTLWMREPWSQRQIRSLKTAIQGAVDARERQCRQDASQRDLFRSTVVQEIEDEVAWRPQMVKALQAKEHFAHLVCAHCT